MEKKYINSRFKHIIHGADYNPDQWINYPEVLKEDLRLMKLAGFNSATVGIFAWDKLEPEDGKYNFEFLDKIMDDIYANGGSIILATPSAARPAWMSVKYPEVDRTTKSFQHRFHGDRENHCYTSPIFRKKIIEIDKLLANRYKDHPALFAWHVSNEYNGSCYCNMCIKEFRNWLKRKYGTLDNLNEQWWTAFWAHTYTDWDQINPPSDISDTAVNGLSLDWERFCSYQTTECMMDEVRVLREITPNVPITTNYHTTSLDLREMSKGLDFTCWDAYPQWRDDESDIDLAMKISFIFDMTRSFLHKPFMLMESTPSTANWWPYNKLKRPGMHMLGSLQAVSHGSDSVQYFQWRKSRGCSEQHHGAVVDHVGHENTRVFREVAELGERLKKLGDIAGTGTPCRVGLIYDMPCAWAVKSAQGFQKDDKKLDITREKFYAPLWKRGINTDIIGFEDRFENYDLIIAPMLYTVSHELEVKLEEYVRNGGRLLCTYMTGMVNENTLCHLGGFPAGKLKDVFGIWNEEIDTLFPGQSNTVLANNGQTYKAVDYCEVIHPYENTEILAKYSSDFYAGGAAVTLNRYGKGEAYYVAFRDEGDYTDLLVDTILKSSNITSDFDGALPYGVTAHSRTDGKKVYVFIQNFTKAEATTSTSLEWKTVEDGTPVRGNIILKPFETIIIEGEL